ncbi:MAG: A/G-specific adenine glycosylase [Saprospiraceae bacterium]|nr:A/G-specific adenine glycosylase [Saprospiraceae bacterium]
MANKIFTTKLLKWFETERRDMPWKQTTDAYCIWVSEIILQQTRVAQGLPYYLRFIKKFPDIKSLARAEEDEVLKLWEGLGYYSRARNMHATANEILEKYDGVFPSTYEKVRALKGIGSYTAAAIMSFAFGQPIAVVDGNVKRVVSRYLAITDAIDDSGSLRQIEFWAQNALDKKHPADFNQAMLDLGATVCLPRNPLCQECPVKSGCGALHNNLTAIIPVKVRKNTKRSRFFHYLVIQNKKGDVLIHRRAGKDIWKGLYEFVLIEKMDKTNLTMAELNDTLKALGLGTKYSVDDTVYCPDKPHILTHQQINTKYYSVLINKYDDLLLRPDLNFVNRGNLTNFAFPRELKAYMEKFLI